MAASAEFVSFIQDVMSGVGPVKTRKFFGGAGVYLDGLMFAMVFDDALYLKVDDTNRGAFEEEGCEPFVYQGKNKPITVNYWRVPDRLLEDEEEMAQWARAAFDVALSTI